MLTITETMDVLENDHPWKDKFFKGWENEKDLEPGIFQMGSNLEPESVLMSGECGKVQSRSTNIKVGVIARDKTDFREWLKENRKPKTTYRMLGRSSTIDPEYYFEVFVTAVADENRFFERIYEKYGCRVAA